jgi:predicted RNA-binding protein with PUA-like domain
MKCEPVHDRRPRRGQWEGVRNYQARNILRDEMAVGDGVLFYASNADPSGVTGLAEIAPRSHGLAKGHDYYDAASTEEHPVWYMVDIRFVEAVPSTS